MKRLMIIALTILVFGSGTASARTPVETEKIDYLISSVENLTGARFIRNGSEYDGKEAAKHLRLKLRNAGERVKTAEDFITYCASRSSVSGKPYLIRLSDGKAMKTEDYFRGKLREFKTGIK